MPVVNWLQPGEGTQFPVRFKTRMRAWWEGYDLSVLQRMIESGEMLAAPPPEPEPANSASLFSADSEPADRMGRPLWTAERIKVAETLWGESFLSPGGVEHTAYLVKPFGINPTMSILDLNAGLGGVARTIARDYKAWVTGLEASPLLASMGEERSAKQKLAKQAPVMHYDPNNIKLDKKYDGIFAKEAFFTVGNKDKLFDEIARHIKPGGQFLFTDYCVEGADMTSPDLVGWMSNEPVEPVLWSAERITKALTDRKLDVRINEDMTPLQKQLILGALSTFLGHLSAHTMDNTTKLAVLDEVELWARRMAAFDHGLRVYRFFCMKH